LIGTIKIKEKIVLLKKYAIKLSEVYALEVTSDNVKEVAAFLLDGQKMKEIPCLVEDDRVEKLWLTNNVAHRLVGYHVLKNELGSYLAVANKIFLEHHELVNSVDEYIELSSYVDFTEYTPKDTNPLGGLAIRITKQSIENLNKFLSDVVILGSHYVDNIQALEGKLTYSITDAEEGTDYSALKLSQVYVTPKGLQLKWRYDKQTVIVGIVKGDLKLVLKC